MFRNIVMEISMRVFLMSIGGLSACLIFLTLAPDTGIIEIVNLAKYYSWKGLVISFVLLCLFFDFDLKLLK